MSVCDVVCERVGLCVMWCVSVWGCVCDLCVCVCECGGCGVCRCVCDVWCGVCVCV